MMECIQFEGEDAFVAEAIGLAEEGFDFVVNAIHASVADPVLPPGGNAGRMAQQGLAQLLHLTHARGHRLGAPKVKIGFHLRVAGLFPKQVQRRLQQIAGVQRLVVVERTLLQSTEENSIATTWLKYSLRSHNRHPAGKKFSQIRVGVKSTTEFLR